MKKSLQSLLLLLVIAFLAVNCKKSSDSNVEAETANIQFNTKMALSNSSDEFQIGDTLYMNTGYDFNVKKFKLYLSHITLEGDNGSVELEDILLADVGDPTTGSFNSSVAVGNYQSLHLGFGLDPQQNDQDPESFPREHPLSSWNQMYWTMLKYRFAILEGRSDDNGQLNGDTTDILNAYHPGLDSLYMTVNYPLNLNLAAGDNQEIDLKIFIDKLFSAGEGIDMRSEPQTHSEMGTATVPGDFHIAKKFMDNLAETATIEVL